MENITPGDSSTLPRLHALREALFYYRNFSVDTLAEYNDLHHRFNSLEEEKDKLQEEKEVWKSQATALECDQKQIDSELQKKEQLMRKMQEELQELRNSLQYHQNEAQTFQSIFSYLKEQFLNLSDAMHLSFMNCENIQVEMCERSQEVKKFNTLMETTKADLREMQAELQSFRKSLQSQQAEAEASHMEKEIWKSQYADLESKQKQMHFELQEKDRLLRETQEELQHLRNSLQLHQEEIEAACNEKEVLKCRVIVSESKQQQMESDLQKKDRLPRETQEEVQVRRNCLQSHQKETEGARITFNNLQKQFVNLQTQASQNQGGSTRLIIFRETRKGEEGDLAVANNDLQNGPESMDLARELITMRLKLKDSFKEWEDRWADQEKRLASQISSLHTAYHKKIEDLANEKDEAATLSEYGKAAVTEKNQKNLTDLMKVETEMHVLDADWTKCFQALEQQLQIEIRAKNEIIQQKEALLKLSQQAEETWMAKEEEWIENKKRTKLDIQVLIDRIVELEQLASKSDWEKAWMKRADKKARKEAAKMREKERRGRGTSEGQETK